jgi:hypothetical protein
MPMRALPPVFALLPLTLALLGCAAAKPDNLVSAVMRQECSVLNLDRGLPYCRAVPAAPEPPPFCTRSRGSVDCWRQPPQATPAYRGLADAPAMPPVERQARPWPRLMEEAEPMRSAEPTRVAPVAEPLRAAPVAEPLGEAPAEVPAQLAPAAEPVRLAPATAPVRPGPDPARPAPAPAPVPLAPTPESVRPAPAPAPVRLAPAAGDRPT